ncbi:MAG TPA: diguanylate cyclase [Turneriella sp.]|nr:diguanylate cyclase [Turneriella sp.]HMY12192.1 diguanylate cyclase [Turneriella sp.]HNJ65151.1 diguanylate cyclase [Turneriella sp.]HNL10978.1 diguanylate cyclase [Turneriella sp.]HNM99189.1 diguanylate cyclase [Turneriella sp.]
METDSLLLAKLRMGQSRLTGLLDQLHLAILLEDENRQVSFVNQAFLDMFGIGLSATEFASIPCEVSAEAAKAAFADPEAFIAGVACRLAERRRVANEILALKDGRWLERNYYPIYIGQDYRGHVWVYSDVTEKVRMHRALKRQATTDTLTGLPNRRRLEADLRRQLQIARRYDRPLSLLLCDIDHFKLINDTHGHHAGDRALRTVAGRIQGLKRAADFAGRWGGEEFLLVLPETDLGAALRLAERLRQAVAGEPVTASGLRATMSIGVNQCSPQDDPETAVAAVDHWLYAAKAAGRNQVMSCLGQFAVNASNG